MCPGPACPSNHRSTFQDKNKDRQSCYLDLKTDCCRSSAQSLGMIQTALHEVVLTGPTNPPLPSQHLVQFGDRTSRSLAAGRPRSLLSVSAWPFCCCACGLLCKVVIRVASEISRRCKSRPSNHRQPMAAGKRRSSRRCRKRASWTTRQRLEIPSCAPSSTSASRPYYSLSATKHLIPRQTHR